MKKILVVAFVISGWSAIADQSTINPGIPAANSSLSSSPIRANFQAAYNDINRLFATSATPGTAGFPLVSQGPSVSAVFGVVAIVGSGHFFTQNNANIHRFNDRVLIGGATINDGAFPNVTKDWLSTFQVAAGLSSGALVSTQFGVLNDPTNASAAVTSLFGAQSLNSTSAGASTIGVSGYAVNNNATLATSAWGLYSECHKVIATVNGCYGLEVDPRAVVASVTPTPFQQGDVVGVQIACGAGLASTNDCSAAAQIQPNPDKWKKGIIFGDTSLTAANGAGGNGIAIESSRNQTMLWRNSGGTVDAEIWGNASGLNISPALGVASGGTGVVTHTTSGILYGVGTSAVGSSRCTMDSTQSVSCTSSSAFSPQFNFTNTTADANAAYFLLSKSRSGGNTNSGDALGNIVAKGFANSASQNSANINFTQAAASSGSNVPSKINIATSNTAGQLNQQLTFDNGAHLGISVQATAPSLTAGCNGAGSSVAGSDMAGTVTGQTAAATTCTLTFGTAYAATPFCTASGQTSPLTGAFTPATGTLVVNFASTANFKWSYVCHGL